MPERIEFFELLRGGGVAVVTHSQNTFWHVSISTRAESEPWCIAIHQLSEFQLPQPNRFTKAGILPSHPLLKDYHEPWLNLYVDRPRIEPSEFLTVIESAVAEETAGWRNLAHYVDPVRATALLRSSGGLLLSAPESVASHIVQVAATSEHPVVLEPRPGVPAPPFRRCVLLLGSGYIIATKIEIRRGYA